MTDIHIETWGTRGERVILVHGGAQGTQSAGHKNFWAQEELAGDGWLLIVPDRPGHGRSPYPGRGDDAVEDAKWLVDLLNSGDAHVVGHSFGGLVALAATASVPNRVKSLTLIEPALHKIAVSHPAVRKVVFGLVLTRLLPFSAATKARRAMKLLGIPDRFDLSNAELTKMGRALGRGQFPSRQEMENWLATIRREGIPFLVISGSASASFTAIGDVAAHKGGGTNIVVPSEHHFPQWAGATFNKRLSDFWRRDASPAG